MMKLNLDKSKYVPITQEMIDQIIELKTQTRTGFHALYKYGKRFTKHEVFKETTNTLPNMWVIGKSKSVNIEHYNAIIETYENIPESHRGNCGSKKVPVAESFRIKLEQFINRPRSLSIAKLLLYTNAPDRLSPALISNIINEKTLSINIEYAEYLNHLISDQKSTDT